MARIDHDFGSKNHFMASYRYYNIKLASDSTRSTLAAFSPAISWARRPPQASDPVQDWYFVAGLTTNITTNFDQRLSLQLPAELVGLGRIGAPPQLPGTRRRA